MGKLSRFCHMANRMANGMANLNLKSTSAKRFDIGTNVRTNGRTYVDNYLREIPSYDSYRAQGGSADPTASQHFPSRSRERIRVIHRPLSVIA
ncbi:hypothetical protein DEU38_13445 [Rhodococcus sp. AG1013]|nr:hypothetical protein DEU38_13445 [Rhodococcus sp. AG1013]